MRTVELVSGAATSDILFRNFRQPTSTKQVISSLLHDVRNMLVHLSSRDFTNGVLSRTGLIVVLFYADWCPFCMAFKPKFEEYARKGGLDFGEANVSHYEDPLWEQFRIQTVPTLLAFKEGKVVKRKDGAPFRGLSQADLDETTSD